MKLVVLGVILLLVIIAVISFFFFSTQSQIDSLKVTQVIDGSTFQLASGQKVKLICVHAPEQGTDGFEIAKEYLSSIVLGQHVELVKDVTNVDSAGNIPRYVYVNDNKTFVNEQMIKSGYTNMIKIFPDVTKCDSLEIAKLTAKNDSMNNSA